MMKILLSLLSLSISSAISESVSMVPTTLKRDQLVLRNPDIRATSESLCSLLCNLDNRRGKYCLAMNYSPGTQTCNLGQMDMASNTGEDVSVNLSPGKGHGFKAGRALNWRIRASNVGMMAVFILFRVLFV